MNWHTKHRESMDFGEIVADSVASFIGSWKFICIQATLMFFWLLANILQYSILRYVNYDPYPFILLNLFMSAEAAFSTPLIMMSQNRQNQRDRVQAEADYQTNVLSKIEIEGIVKHLEEIDTGKLDLIIKLLNNKEMLSKRLKNGRFAKKK